jgi:hypothetical protein
MMPTVSRLAFGISAAVNAMPERCMRSPIERWSRLRGGRPMYLLLAKRQVCLVGLCGVRRIETAYCGRIEMTRSWIHFTRGRFVRQARVGLGDLRGRTFESAGLCRAGRDALPH